MSRSASKGGMYPVSTDNPSKRNMDSCKNNTSGTNDEDRPTKISRREIHSNDQRQPEHLFRSLQQLIHGFGQVIPSKDALSEIIDFAQKSTDLLKKNGACIERSDRNRFDSMLEQVHGLLCLWFDFAISTFSSCDITSDDCVDIRSKLIEVTNHVCTCLGEVYRCAVMNLYTTETLQILMKAYLLLVSDPSDAPMPSDCEGMVSLLRALVVTVRNINCDTLLSFYTYQRFLLCLVRTIVNSETGREYPVGSISSEILQMLCSTTLRCDLDECIVRAFTNVAWSTVSDPNQAATMSTSSAVDIFRLQCVLHLPSFEIRKLTAGIVSSFVRKVTSRRVESFDTLVQIQALDCMVAISSRVSLSDSLDPLSVGVLEALLQILVECDSMSDFDVFLKGKATEGLQNMLAVDDSLSRCVLWLTEKKELRVNRFLSSLRDVTHVVEYQRMYGHRCSYGSIVDISIFRMDGIAVSAAEILLSLLCLSLQRFESDSMFVPVCYVVSTCVEFLECTHFMNQHVVYLTVHMICREKREIFFSIVQTYPDLLSSLAKLLLWDIDDDLNTVPICLILSFLQDLLQACPSFSLVAARQKGVVEAITHVAHSSLQELGDENDENRVVAIQLLYTLSYDVFNRRLMARRANVLSSMIRFVRGIGVGASNSNISGTPSSGLHRDAIKERISQLVAVM